MRPSAAPARKLIAQPKALHLPQYLNSGSKPLRKPPQRRKFDENLACDESDHAHPVAPATKPNAYSKIERSCGFRMISTDFNLTKTSRLHETANGNDTRRSPCTRSPSKTPKEDHGRFANLTGIAAQKRRLPNPAAGQRNDMQRRKSYNVRTGALKTTFCPS